MTGFDRVEKLQLRNWSLRQGSLALVVIGGACGHRRPVFGPACPLRLALISCVIALAASGLIEMAKALTGLVDLNLI